MSLVAAWFWGILLVAATVLVSIAGSLLVRRWATVEVLECHKEVAGFIYAVIGVLYAVLLGFTAIIVWERYEKAHTSVEQEANEVADLFRDAQVFERAPERAGVAAPHLCPACVGKRVAGDGRRRVEPRNLGGV
jgi:hypothetical protein